MSLTPLSAQTGKQNPDTVKCYGLTELRYIASTLVEAKTCDTLLAISNAKVFNRDSMIVEKNYEIDQLNKQLKIKDQLIELRDQEIMRLATYTEKLERHKKWLKVGWIASTTILGGAIIYLAGH